MASAHGRRLAVVLLAAVLAYVSADATQVSSRSLAAADVALTVRSECPYPVAFRAVFDTESTAGYGCVYTFRISELGMDFCVSDWQTIKPSGSLQVPLDASTFGVSWSAYTARDLRYALAGGLPTSYLGSARNDRDECTSEAPLNTCVWWSTADPADELVIGCPGYDPAAPASPPPPPVEEEQGPIEVYNECPRPVAFRAAYEIVDNATELSCRAVVEGDETWVQLCMTPWETIPAQGSTWVDTSPYAYWQYSAYVAPAGAGDGAPKSQALSTTYSTTTGERIEAGLFNRSMQPCAAENRTEGCVWWIEAVTGYKYSDPMDTTRWMIISC